MNTHDHCLPYVTSSWKTAVRPLVTVASSRSSPTIAINSEKQLQTSQQKLNKFCLVYNVALIFIATYLFAAVEKPAQMTVEQLIDGVTVVAKQKSFEINMMKQLLDQIYAADRHGIKLRVNFDIVIVDGKTTNETSSTDTETTKINLKLTSPHGVVFTKYGGMFAPVHDWCSSLLFVISIITTIGYGNLPPVTPTGKLLCIVISSIGIPSTLSLLSYLVQQLRRKPAKAVESLIAHNLFKYRQIKSLLVIRFAHLSFFVAFALITCLLIPGAFFRWFENNWSYLDCVYYCYVSITTIGLGDFVPATRPSIQRGFYTIATIFYLYYGLTAMMLVYELIKRFNNTVCSIITVSPQRIPCPPQRANRQTYGTILYSRSVC